MSFAEKNIGPTIRLELERTQVCVACLYSFDSPWD